MSAQLPLQLSHSIRYSSLDFLEHAGVSEVVATVLAIAAHKRKFSLIYLQGEKLSGKTHTGVYIVGRVQELARNARLLRGPDLGEWFVDELPTNPFRAGELCVIDDADIFLENAQSQGQAGLFVDIVERLAHANGTLVLLGTTTPDKITTSSQAQSRIGAGMHLVLGNPVEADLNQLLHMITKQRGLQLTEGKCAYILRRVPRVIPALVECIERLEEGNDFTEASTSFHLLSEALTVERV